MTVVPPDDQLLADAVEWRMRVDAAPEDAALRSALDEWLAQSEAHRTAYSDVDHTVSLIGLLPSGSVHDTYVHQTSQDLPHRRLKRRRRIVRAIGLAFAACLAMLFLPTALLWLQSDYRTSTAELRTVTLEDGTSVALDGESAIAVKYTPNRREVLLLAGQAYFDVKSNSDRPFVVVAEPVAVTVTGTSFNVGTSGKSLVVSVQSGTVEVGLDFGRRPVATVARGERLEIQKSSGRFSRSGIAPTDVATWRERRLVADSATMAEVLDELRRHYSGVVLLRDRAFADRQVSGVFNLNQPIEALQAAVHAHGGRVTRVTPYLVVVEGQ